MKTDHCDENELQNRNLKYCVQPIRNMSKNCKKERRRKVPDTLHTKGYGSHIITPSGWKLPEMLSLLGQKAFIKKQRKKID